MEARRIELGAPTTFRDAGPHLVVSRGAVDLTAGLAYILVGRATFRGRDWVVDQERQTSSVPGREGQPEMLQALYVFFV